MPTKKKSKKVQSSKRQCRQRNSTVQSVESRIEQNLSELCDLNSELRRSNGQNSPQSSPRVPSSGAIPAIGPPPTTDPPVTEPPPTPEQILTTLDDAISDIEKMITELQSNLPIDVNLTGLERKRLFGVRSRKFGFITNAWNIARDNPEFVPPNFSLAGMATTVTILEKVRQLTLLQEQYLKLADDFLLMTCDTAYRDALRIYGNLREQSRGRVPGAAALFQELRQFFILRRRRFGETEPTQREVERDLRALLRGTKDGEIVVRNESDRVVKGERVVIDETQKATPRGGVKVVERGEVE